MLLTSVEDTDLLKLSKTCYEKKPEIEISPLFNNSGFNYFACSKNFKYLKKGQLLNKSSKLETSSQLKPRILKIPILEKYTSFTAKQKIEKDSRARELKENTKKQTYKT